MHINLSLKKFVSIAMLLLCVFTTKAQLIATYPLKSGGANPPVGTTLAAGTSANVNASAVTVGTQIASTPAGSYNGSGLRMKLNSGVNTWPNSPTDEYNLDVTISPKANYDFTLDSISYIVNAVNSSEALFAVPMYQVDGVGAWHSITGATAQSTNTKITVHFAPLNEGFYNTHTYKFRLFFFGTATTKGQDVRINTLIFYGKTITPPAVKPSVHANSAMPTSTYAGTAQGNFDQGSGFQIANQAGFIYSTNAVPTFANSLAVFASSVTSPLNEMISGLTPGTTYNIKAFIITQTDTIISTETVGLTTYPYSVPLLNTSPPTNVLSNKATTGGIWIDSGGYGVVEKGVLFDATTSNLVYPAVLPTKATSDGVGNADYTSILKNLTPNTKYYIMAYARNQLGAGYGGLDSFITGPPAPTITATPNILDFGDITFNNTTPILSYKLNATYLTPAAGTITINVSPTTQGYSICGTLNGVYGTSLTVPYVNGTITNKIVYVKSASTPYGNLKANILHSGGGVVTPNADTVFLTTNVVQNPDTLSNAGTDFWTGFGYEEKMSQKSGSSSEAHMSIYVITGNQPANVHVDLAAAGYSQNFTIPANSFHEFTNFPTGDPTNASNPTYLPDSRLFSTSISNKAVHIYTDNNVPVSAFLHTYTNANTAAGAMIFPTNTWNSSYTVQAFGGTSNNSDPNSFFFVIANQDNTVVTFSPTQPILDSTNTSLFNSNPTTAANTAFAAGGTYSVTLNKGQVFNAMGGFGNSNNGLDLSGTTVSTTCDKKIAVFGGNGRCLVNGLNCSQSSGSDHLIQQMFPSVAWGTKYITRPTKTEPTNYYRIYVKNPTLYGATKVWVNNPSHTTPLTVLINNLYYEYQSTQPLLIESDKPINVSQFIMTPPCSAPYADGGPEMIILSPVQQSINSVIVYSAPFKTSGSNPAQANGSVGNGASFINVVIPNNGISSFKLDNLSVADTGTAWGTSTSGNSSVYSASTVLIPMTSVFRKHPVDTSYSTATFWVTTAQPHKLSSNVGFNAIAYGMGNGESYGYNAGTTINNLSALHFSLNPYGSDTSSGSVKTCKGNLVTLQIALPYDTSTVNSITWNPGADATSYAPTGPQLGTINPNTTKPVCVGTIVKDGRTFYIYKSPVQYTFFQEGAYKVKVIVNGTFASDCGGLDNEYVNVIVGHDDISFTAIPGACGTTKVTITDASTPLAGTTLLKWIWDFGDNTKKDTLPNGSSAGPNPTINPHNYPANTSYTIKLTTINSVGCFTTDSVTVSLAYNISTSFTQSQDTICPNASVVFTPTSSSAAAKWFWDFGDGSPTAIDSSNLAPNPVSHQYTTQGTYIVKHFVKTAAGCPSAIVQDTVIVVHQPVADFVLPSGVCLPGNTLFTNTSDTANLSTPSGVPYTYHWSFGTGVAGDTSDVKNPVFVYSSAPGAGGYAVSLTATNRFGCVSTPKVQNVTTVYNKPTALIANTSNKKVCAGINANFVDSSSGKNQTVNSWYWNFGDNTTSTQQNPQHSYATNTVYTVKLAIGTDKGCVSDTATWNIKVNPKPVAGTILPSSCITSGSLFFQDNSTVAIDDSTQTPYTYTWNFGDATGIFNTKDSTHTYAGVGTYYINHTITTLNGCTDTKTDTFSISGSKPVPGFSIGNSSGLCSNVDVVLTDTSRVAIGTVKKVEIRWDATNNYANVQTDNSPSNGAAGSSKNYNHKYPSLPTTQTYVVRLYAYSGTTCMDSAEQTITVYGSPKVVFDTLKGICLNASPRYIHLAHDSSGVFNNATLANYYYSGTAVVADTFYPAVAGVGNYIIKAVFETVTPASHCRDSATSPIKVWAIPTVSFTTSTPLCEKSSVAFTDHSTAGAGTGNISSWSWNFGDVTSGINNTSATQNPTHNYASYNTYTVNFTATSDSGCSAAATPVTITIHPKPQVGFIVPAGVCSGTAVGFTDTSKIADNSESQFTHYWNFGDHTSATGTPLPNTSHLYAGSPTDSVRLIVTSKDGCKDSLVVKLSSVVFPQQNPVFSANGRTINGSNDTIRTCVGNAILFTNQNAPTVNQGYWEFGDTAALVNPGKSVSHIYPNATVYTGKHYADDSHGCRTTTATFNVLVWALPTPIIKVNNPTCEKNSITFTDGSTTAVGSGNVNAWSWHFGDPTSLGLDSASTQVAAHNYGTTGAYNVTLTVTSDSGCKATTPIAIVVNVHPLPVVKFGLPAAVCLPLAAQFSDSSTITDGSEAQFTHSWDFGDIASGANNTATGTPLPTPTHIFTVSNNYTIKLTVTSKDGCVSVASNLLNASAIHNQPKANYSVNPLDHATPRVCIGTPIFFKDSSGGNTATSYWVWGDNGFALDSAKIINHVYPAGSYAGEHFITDNFGCRSDTIGFLAMIDTFPVVNDGIKYILAGTSDILKPDVSGGNTYLWNVIVPFGSTKTYLDLNDIEMPICTPLIDSIVYKVDVTGDGVCPAKSLYYTVRTFTQPVIPNVFSPNGDGVNDYWDISSLKYFTGANVQVFNRYGQVVLSRLGYSRPWDGNDANGKPLPVGTYYYVIQLGYGFEPRSGSITILR